MAERVNKKKKKLRSLRNEGRRQSFFPPCPIPLLSSLSPLLASTMNGSGDPFADGGDDGDSGNPLAALGALLEASPIAPVLLSLRQRQQRLLDASTPHVSRRWAALAALVLVYGLRVWSLQGFYIVTYALGIYNLNLLLGFLTPQVSFGIDCIGFFFFFQSIDDDDRSLPSSTPFSLSPLTSLLSHQPTTNRPTTTTTNRSTPSSRDLLCPPSARTSSDPSSAAFRSSSSGGRARGPWRPLCSRRSSRCSTFRFSGRSCWSTSAPCSS
jgi:hypothetical protein